MFNNKLMNALKTGIFKCDKCGSRMKAIDETGDYYVCPFCGYDTDVEHYGYLEEEYENLYPPIEDVLEYYETDEDEYNGENYEEVFNELSHDE